MNVVFLLLTTAVSAGADPAPAAAPAPVASSCGCGCGTISDCCEKPSFFDKLRAYFAKSSCCESTCCSAPAPCSKPTSCCDSCYSKPSLFDKIRASFAKHDCCDVCSSCGAPAAAPAAAPASTPPPEKLKKMPKGEGESKSTQLIVPATPNLTPAGAKIETEIKNPF